MTASRRDFLRGAAALGGALLVPGCGPTPAGAPAGAAPAPPKPPDFTLRIAPLTIEPAPGHRITTTAYNGSVPGPLLRMRAGVPVTVEIHNDTDAPELVHWHGQALPAEVDGAAEEGTPFVPARGMRRYTFAPGPAGTRWYHTHVHAGADLTRGAYSGQFGFVQVAARHEPAPYDQEIHLAVHEWQPQLSDAGSDGGQITYRMHSINGLALGYGEPLRVQQGQRVLLHLLNASASNLLRLALPGHRFQVLALDGNSVPTPATVDILQLGAGERIDALVQMNQPGVWVLGSTTGRDRDAGCGIVVEYAGQTGKPRWLPPPHQIWDYAWFGGTGFLQPPDKQFPLVFGRSSPPAAGSALTAARAGSGAAAGAGAAPGISPAGGPDAGASAVAGLWTVNGQPYPKNSPVYLIPYRHYRFLLRNPTDQGYSIHLHRHTLQLTKLNGRRTAGILKDVVYLDAHAEIEADLIADNPGLTLFHCHQQLQMDNGFMVLFQYI